MYTFIRAIAVKHGYNQRWEDVDISAIPTNILFIKYRQIYAVLTQSTIIGDLTLDLQSIAPQLQSNTGTISDYLSSIGNTALATTAGTPVIVRNQVVFSDAVQADYDIAPADYNLGEGDETPDDFLDHLRITRQTDGEPIDWLAFRQVVIPSINGFYHSMSADSRGYYIQNGNKSVRKSGRRHIGLTSFGTIGPLEYISLLEPELIFDFRPNTQEVDRVTLVFQKDAFKDKTPFLVLGGYMVLVDGDTLSAPTDNVLVFKTRKYPTLERYFESRDTLDYDAFPIVKDPNNPGWVLASSFRTEAYWRSLFTMNQSFVARIPSTKLIVERVYPELQTVPNTFMSYERPKWPLVVCEGKHEVYWSQYEDKSWVLTCGDTYKRNYMFQSSPNGELVGIDDALQLADAGRYSPGYFLKIIDEKIEIKTTA